MIKRILVGLAGTPYTEVAVRRAVELAQLHGAEVTGVTAVDVQRLSNVGSVPIGAEGAVNELRDHRFQITSEHVSEAVAGFKTACERGKVSFRVVCEEGDALKLMQGYSRYHDLTIFGLRSIFEYYFEDSDSSKLLAQLVGGGVRPIVAVSREFRPIRRVLVGYNGSVGSARTLRQFVQMMPWPEAEVQIVHFGQEGGEGRKLLADAADYCRIHGVEAQTLQIDGSSHDGLLEQAEAWDADLVALGNSGRSFLMRQLFGETALHVIRHANRPLFLSQ
jgi:nucleotide-binding universal stress UspA family protein